MAKGETGVAAFRAALSGTSAPAGWPPALRYEPRCWHDLERRAWPAMIALSMAAMIAAAVVSFAHRALAPKRAAEIEAEAEALAGEALRGLADAPGLRSDVAQRLRERPGGVASPPDR